MQEPLVTICVPTYNGARYLSEALRCIEMQTYRNIEVVLCDDASSDETPSILKEYARCRSNVRLYRNSCNLGMVGNWNACAAYARGEFVKFLFQDDIIHPDAVAALVDRALATNSVLTACRRELRFESDDVSHQIRKNLLRHAVHMESFQSQAEYFEPREFATEIALQPTSNLFGEPTAVLFSTAAFRRGRPFDNRLIQICDADLFNRLALRGRISFVPERLAMFRWHEGSASSANHGVRALRTRIVEPAQLLSLMLRDDEYKPLRSAVRGSSGYTSIRRRYNSLVHWGRKEIYAAASTGAVSGVEREQLLSMLSGLPPTPELPFDRLCWYLKSLKAGLRFGCASVEDEK